MAVLPSCLTRALWHGANRTSHWHEARADFAIDLAGTAPPLGAADEDAARLVVRAEYRRGRLPTGFGPPRDRPVWFVCEPVDAGADAAIALLRERGAFAVGSCSAEVTWRYDGRAARAMQLQLRGRVRSDAVGVEVQAPNFALPEEPDLPPVLAEVQSAILAGDWSMLMSGPVPPAAPSSATAVAWCTDDGEVLAADAVRELAGPLAERPWLPLAQRLECCRHLALLVRVWAADGPHHLLLWAAPALLSVQTAPVGHEVAFALQSQWSPRVACVPPAGMQPFASGTAPRGDLTLRSWYRRWTARAVRGFLWRALATPFALLGDAVLQVGEWVLEDAVHGLQLKAHNDHGTVHARVQERPRR